MDLERPKVEPPQENSIVSEQSELQTTCSPSVESSTLYSSISLSLNFCQDPSIKYQPLVNILALRISLKFSPNWSPPQYLFPIWPGSSQSAKLWHATKIFKYKVFIRDSDQGSTSPIMLYVERERELVRFSKLLASSNKRQD